MKVSLCFGAADSRTTALQMAQAQAILPQHRCEVINLGNRGALGIVHTSEEFSKIPSLYRGPQGEIVAIAGVPTSDRGNYSTLIESALTSGVSAVIETLTSLEGAFFAAFWDAPTQNLYLVTDVLGFQHLYSYEAQGIRLFSSELRGMCASGVIPGRMDPVGWGAQIAFGHWITQVTSIEGVRRLKPASIYTINAVDFGSEVREYWTYPIREKSLPVSLIQTSELKSLLLKNIKNYLEHNSKATLLLSAGFDSRLLLFALLELGLSPEVLIAHHPDEIFDADGKIARQIACKLGLRFREFYPSPHFFSSTEYLHYLNAVEVSTASINLFIPVVYGQLTREMRAVWEGVAPAITFGTPFEGVTSLAQYVGHKCADFDSAVWRAARLVFSEQLYAQIAEAFKREIDQEVRRYPSGAEGAAQFAILNRTANRTGLNPCKVYANQVLPYTPCYSRPILDYTIPVEPLARQRSQFYTQFFKECFPKALQFPFCSAGHMIQPSPRRLCDQKWNVLEQIDSNRYINALRSRTGIKFEWKPSSFVRQTLQTTSLDHPELNPDGIRKLRLGKPTPYISELGAQLLFYWKSWRKMVLGLAE